MIKHKKHTNLARRYNDNFAPNEISFSGTNCGNISDLVTKISRKLSKYKLAYFDASHAKDVEKNSLSHNSLKLIVFITKFNAPYFVST